MVASVQSTAPAGKPHANQQGCGEQGLPSFCCHSRGSPVRVLVLGAKDWLRHGVQKRQVVLQPAGVEEGGLKLCSGGLAGRGRAGGVGLSGLAGRERTRCARSGARRRAAQSGSPLPEVEGVAQVPPKVDLKGLGPYGESRGKGPSEMQQLPGVPSPKQLAPACLRPNFLAANQTCCMRRLAP